MHGRRIGKLRRSRWTWAAGPTLTWAGAGLGIWLLWHGLPGLLPMAAAGDAESSDVPIGTVAFFGRADGTCPVGWRVAEQAKGRLIVGSSAADAIGKSVGTPLSDQEDRSHRHPYAASVELPYKSISAADGPNNQGAGTKKLETSGQSAASPSGLPFVQLAVCEKL